MSKLTKLKFTPTTTQNATSNKKIIPFLRGAFSQWHKSNFTIDNVTYNCAEQYMMAEKAKLFKDDDIYKQILAASNPGTQKALGRKVKNFDNKIWTQHRYDIVLKGNIAKFSQNSKIKKKLMDTKDAILCETNPKDKIWGIGLKTSDPKVQDQSKWKGTNLLGKVLMEVRKKLNEESE
jgi:ribA/ribD-fused uncharacterized protein